MFKQNIELKSGIGFKPVNYDLQTEWIAITSLRVVLSKCNGGFFAAVAMALVIFTIPATGQTQPPNKLPTLPKREIRVPFADLPVLLGGKNERMFMTRSEYDELLKKANVTPEQLAAARQEQLDESNIPTNVVMLDAVHKVTIEAGRAVIQSDLTIEVLKTGLQSVHLTLQHVGLIAATLDDAPAMLSKSIDANIVAGIVLNSRVRTGLPGATLFLDGKGRHRLSLTMVAAVSTSAAQQTLTIALPHAATNKWTMRVPGNVEILSGVNVRSRKVDSETNVTEFEWIPIATQNSFLNCSYSIVMTLNNKMLRDTRALAAKSFLLTEITEAYEQVTQRITINVLNGAENKFQIAIPNGFEIQKVQSQLLSRWNTLAKTDSPNGVGRILGIELREPVSDQVDFDIVASKSTRSIYSETPTVWNWTEWSVLDAESQSAILALSIERDLRMQSIEYGALIPLDEGILAASIPIELRGRESSAPKVRPIATMYAPDSSQTITAQITKPRSMAKSSFNNLAIVSESGVRARTMIDVESGNESIANFEVLLSSGWRLQSAKLLDGTFLPFEALKTDGAVSTTRVRLARPFAPNTRTRLILECSTVPNGWLSNWSEQSIPYPVITVAGTEIGPSVLSAVGEGDITLEVSKFENLIALFESERIALQIQGDGSGPSFSAQGANWSLELLAKRKKPQLTAEVFSFFKIESEGIRSVHELHLDVKQAATDAFEFTLPNSTPQELTIRGMDKVSVKETTSRVESGNRIWSIKLANRVTGRARLYVEYTKSLETGVELSLPIASVSQTVYQTGVIAIEGDDELEVSVLKHPRVADVGELTESSYAVGNRLLGVYGYSVSDPGSDTISILATRRELRSVPSTIVERAQLSTALSAHGASYHVAELQLRTTGGFIQAKLPLDAVLWSITVDGLPSLPQRSDEQLLIELRAKSSVSPTSNTVPHNGDPNLHILRIAYETRIRLVGMRTDVDLVAPLLATMETASSPSVPVPTADMGWQVWVPGELRVIESIGDLQLSGNDDQTGFPYNIFDTLSLAFNSRAAAPKTWNDVSESRWLESTKSLPSPANRTLSRSLTVDSSIEGRRLANPAKAGQTAQTAQTQPPQAPAAKPLPIADEPSMVDLFAVAVPQTEDPFGQTEKETLDETLSRKDAAASFLNQKSFEGLRTLPIDFEGPTTWQSINMTGFGDSPNIRLSVVNNTRLYWITSSLAAFIITIGLAFLGRPVGQVVRWTLSAMAFSIGIALMSPWPIETGILASGAFYASLVVLVTRLLFGVIRSVRAMSLRSPISAISGLLFCFVLSIATTGRNAVAQETPVGKDIRSLDELISILKLHTTTTSGTIEIPSDAIVVPYQPDTPPVRAGAEKILVPYSIYTQLMNLANPDKVDKKIIEQPVEYSLSNLSYEATLDRDDFLTVTLRIDITPHTERGILVPLGFQGAVLTSTKLNDKSAPISSGPNGLALLVKGVRTHSFTATLQIPIQRQGGWRIVNANLPTAASGKMKLSIPSANTEVRLLGLPDVEQRETTQSNETIVTSIATDGKLSLQWRPKVSESVADQGLSVDTDYSLAIEEQGIHTVWDVKLEFRRGRRDRFEFLLPKDLVIERVTGKNIRGWTIDNQIEKQVLKVTLLKSAVESERLSIVASRSMRMGAAAELTAIAPQLLMPEAMLQRGRITIYRSALLDLEIGDTSGLVREDLKSDLQPLVSGSPVPLKMFQTYRYASPEFQLSLKVNEVINKLKSQTETVLRVSRNDASLQSQINLSAGSRPLFRLKIEVPADWQWDDPRSGAPMEWTLSEAKDGARILDILFLKGQNGTIPIRLNATQNRSSDLQSNDYTLDLPKIRSLDATSDQGEVQIYTDVGANVRPEQLEGCEIVGSNSNAAKAGQNVLPSATPQAIIRYNAGSYKGLLRFQSRVPLITAMSISNVKVTRRSLEETVYFEWDIKEAGVHRFEFVLPGRLKDAVVLAQMVRNIQRIPTTDQPDATMKFVVELQEDVIGQYRILVQKDSPLPSGLHGVPIPTVLTGSVDNRFVTLENSGRDELLVDALKGVTQMVRGDSQWVKLQSLLGGKSADVYRVDSGRTTSGPSEQDSGNEPVLSFKTQSRSLVATASARIGLAHCVISVDEASNYRATQEFRIENTSEAYLELEMPASAQLWTAMVAGAPVKPIQSSNKPTRAGSTRLRLPLVRTQTGDLDYGVELKYAGRLNKAGFVSKLEFPLIESININVELSQVKLHLPENQYWYGFDGTLGQVQGESEFLAGWLAHKNKQIGRLSEITTNDSEVFSKARAEENLKQLDSSVRFQLGNSKFNLNSNPNLQQQMQKNDFVLNEAKTQAAKSEKESGQKTVLDNRDVFNGLLDSQINYRANGNAVRVYPSNQEIDVKEASKATDKLGALPQLMGQPFPTQPLAEKSIESVNDEAKGFIYQGRRPGKAGQSILNPMGDSKDSKNLANLYRNKLQGQVNQPQGVTSYGNSSDLSVPSSGQSGAAGLGGGMGGMPGMSGMGAARNSDGGYVNGRESGMAGGEGGYDTSNNFGVTPSFGSPDRFGSPEHAKRSGGTEQNQNHAGYDVLAGTIDQAVSPNTWQSSGGTSSMREFRQNLSLVVTAPQETEHAYMASLAVTLPVRGKEFFFTTPRGDIVLSANGISKTVSQRGIGLLMLVVAVTLVAATRRRQFENKL